MSRGAVPVVLATVVVLLGVALIARTVSLGVGGGLGLLIGGLLVIGARCASTCCGRGAEADPARAGPPRLARSR